MVGLIILGVIIAIIVAIMLVPVGADVAYEGGELRLSAKVCGMLLFMMPVINQHSSSSSVQQMQN